MSLKAASTTVSEKKLGSEIMQLAWPAALLLLLENFYRGNDLFFVKWLGREAQSALAVAGMVNILCFALYGGIAIGTLSLSARAHGAGMGIRARQYLRVAIVLSVIAAAVIAGLGFFLMDSLLPFLIPDDPAREAFVVLKERDNLRSYLNPIFAGAFFLCLASVVEHAFLANKDSRTPLMLQFLAVLGNTALNPLLIYGLGPVPALGTAGAGLATVLSRAFVALIGLMILRRRLGKTGTRDPRTQFEQGLKIVRIATPVVISIALYALVYQIIMHTTFAPFGAVGRAAFGAGFVLEGLAFCIIWGLAMASGSLVARNLGAGRPDLARLVVRKTANFVLVLSIPLSLLFYFLPAPLAALLTSDPQVRLQIIIYLQCLAFSQFAVGLQGVYEQSLMSAGYSLSVSLWTGFWNLSRIPLASWLAITEGYGLAGIWWAINLSTYGKALTSAILVRRGNWLRSTKQDT